MTLVELVIAIVIVGIAAAALYSAMAAITARSADPMLRQQSLMIAEAYLEEILAKPYDEADPPAGCTNSERRCFNDVRDYHSHGEFQAPQDVAGEAIDKLASYGVKIEVSELQKPAFNGEAALRIDVTVRDPQGQTLTLTGWRTCYGEVCL
ncbi:type IV pilus modification PilV family protein [Geopseudomonas guangdongensis]|nr:prepilin-type N-terminal cleavage/methylation domain-containing protein [Pseudomonas guangdongensis]